MKLILSIILLGSVSVYAQGLTLLGAGKAASGGGGGGAITITDAGSTVQASGHTCTIASVALSTGDSVSIMSATLGLAATITATWNGSSCTEDAGGGFGVGIVESHLFNCNNVTGGTGSVVMTKTSSSDDALTFDCAAVKITGLTAHAIDADVSNTSSSATSWSTTAATTTTAAEGLVAWFTASSNTAAATGAWQTSFVRLARAGQASGTCCLIDYASRVVSSTGSYSGDDNANTTAAFIGVLLGFK